MTPRAWIVAGFLLGSAAGLATAHEHVDVADGRYELTIGWREEPAYLGEPNGLDLKVARKATEPHHGGHGHGDLFQSDELHHGDHFEFTFTHDHEGVQMYHDHVTAHAGTVTVSDEATGSGTVTIELTDDGFEPADVTVQPDTTVRWVNERDEVAIVASGEHSGTGHEDGAHAHDEEDVVLHAHENLTVAYEYAGETFFPPDFRPSHGRPGWYTAEITPTRPGVYTLHISGTIEGHAVDVRVEPHEIEGLEGVSFPAVDPAYHELVQRVDALEAEIQAQIRNPPPVTDQPTSDLPGFGVVALAGAVAVAFMLARRVR